ncbi:uncharacterized protein LOC135349302 isoform X3 [Halichondria panicea]|uniref:uncharacterized protein LOC135349302 isoform X3 n=1 Tax=Halichondria panicea TaxID=6063 RepID=UPI00312B57BF
MHTQELLAAVHDILINRSTANIRATFEGVTEGTTKHDSTGNFLFRKNSCFRGLFIFKTSTRVHILLPNQSGMRASPVCVAFTNEHGRRVLPFLNTHSQGQGYKSFKMLPDCLHAYVDRCEPFSSLGIFKVCTPLNQVLKILSPKHKVALDIASYFRPTETGNPPELGEAFPEVPMAGLQQRRTKKNTSKATKQKLSKSKTQTVPSNQPLIDKALQDATATVTAQTLYSETNLPADFLDDLFDFNSQPCNEVVPSINDTNEDNDLTPPLDIDPPPIKKHARNSTRIKGQSHTKSHTKSRNVKAHSVSELIRSNGLKHKSLVLKNEKLSSNKQSNALEPVSQMFSDPDEFPNDETFPLTPIPSITDITTVTGGGCSHGNEQVLEDATTNQRAQSPPVSTTSSTESLSARDMEEVCILVSSDEEVIVTGSQKGGNKKKKRRMVKSLLSLEQIMDGVSRIKDMTQAKIIQWLRLRKPLIVDIFKGRLLSQRHSDYLVGSKKRAMLKYQMDTSMFNEEQLETLHTNVLNVFCSQSMKYFDYVMNVLIPECVIRLIADINGVSFDEAEEMMYTFESSIDLCQDN